MKLLYITTLARDKFGTFVKSAIYAAKNEGIELHIASNETGINQSVKNAECSELGIYHHHIDINRNPLMLAENHRAYHQILDLIKAHGFDAIHCNTPVGGVLGRLCGKRMSVPYVIYQAHGFHFWKGAPLKNWLLYYPIEWLLARYTDLLITINREDHQNAQKFRLKKGGKLVFVHGVGVDSDKVERVHIDKSEKRAALGVPANATVFVTVGELNENKNHITAIDAFAEANIPRAFFLICGSGEKEKELKTHIAEKGMADKIIMLGFRSDIFEILKASDVFLFPSFREGLPGALMEAMAAGLPCIASRIRGNVDLLGDEYPYLFDASDIRSMSRKMKQIVNDPGRHGAYCRERVKPYALPAVVEELKSIYRSIPGM